MKCPKCGSVHIRPDGSCLMCGMYVAEEKIPERLCFCCARKLPIIGDTCPECEQAINMGAKALMKGRLKNRKSDKEIVAATCPALEPLEVLYQKYHEHREHLRAVKRAWREKNKERLREQERNRVLSEEAKEHRREYDRERSKKPERLAWQKAYRQSEAGKEASRKSNAKLRNMPGFRERQREHERHYRERKRAERLAMTPKELEEYRQSERYQKQLAAVRAYKAKRRADPETHQRDLEYDREYRARPENVIRRKLSIARYEAKKRLIRENEKLDKVRLMEGMTLYERQWEASFAEDCGNSGAVRGDSLRGDNVGKGQLGVAVHRGVHAAAGPQVAQNGPVGV